MKFMHSRFLAFIITTLAGFIFLLLGMSVLNAALDPLHVLYPPKASDFYDSESRFAIPGLLRHNASPHAVVGSSIVQDFDEAYYQKKSGEPITRYFLTGGTAYEQRRMIETLLQSSRAPAVVIWGIAPTSFFHKDVQSVRWSQFPEYLFQKDPSLIRYIFSYQTFYRLLRQIPARLKGTAQTAQERFLSDAHATPLGRDNIYASYCGEKMQERLARLHAYNYPLMQAQIEQNMVPILTAHPDARFVFFLPPYSLVQFVEFDQAGFLGEVMAFRRLLADTAARYGNVTLYDFQADIPMISDDDDHRDSIHYGQKTTRRMIDDMLSGRNKIIAAQIEARTKTLESVVKQRRDAIWRDIKDYCAEAGQPVLLP